MKQRITRRSFVGTTAVAAGLAPFVPSILNLQEARAASGSDEIVAMDLLTVKQPRSQAESRMRVIRLTTRGGTTGYGDYLDYGLPAHFE